MPSFEGEHEAANFHLVCVQGEQGTKQWPLPSDRAIIVGRRAASSAGPDVDLWPDNRVSRHHVRIWFEDSAWWLEDLKSKHGTLLGARKLKGQGPTRLEPWTEFKIGDTTLMLAPPQWYRLTLDQLLVDLEVSPTINFSLAQGNHPLISRLVIRNQGSKAYTSGHLEFVTPGFGDAEGVRFSRLEAGESRQLPLPNFRFDSNTLECRAERQKVRLSVSVDGREAQGNHIEYWVLPHNEWSLCAEHRVSLAAFVLPNHPVVSQVALDACRYSGVWTDARPVLEGLYKHLYGQWNLTYRLEPAGGVAHSQRVRLPHQVLVDLERRIGQGTCIDLALLLAGCIESQGFQPLIAIVEGEGGMHALAGCWIKPHAGLEPLIFDKARLLEHAIWVDPNGLTRDVRFRMELGSSSKAASLCLSGGRLMFALDVAAARRDGIRPLPFAGEPQWSSAVTYAVHRAHELAAAVPTRMGTVPLLLGLLSLDGGVTRTVFSDRFEDVALVTRHLAQALRKQKPATPSSRNCVHVLDLARSQAKVEGSPLVLEAHVLFALLQVEGSAVDAALKTLATSRLELAAILDNISRSSRKNGSYSTFSEFSDSGRLSGSQDDPNPNAA